MNRTLFIIGMLTMTLASAGILYSAYLSFYPFDWLKYYNEPFPVLNENKTVRAGEFLIYEIEYCRWNDKQATFSKDILGIDNANGITLPTFRSSFGAICAKEEAPQKVVINSTHIPLHLPEGEYYMRMLVEQPLNPLRTESLTVETEPFKVVK